MDESPRVALAHDYLTQRGGAERVVLALARTFPGAPLYTSLYEPAGTYPGFGAVDVRPSTLNALGPLRSRHRIALPLLAPAFSSMRIDAEVTVCSSSGWAHGVRVSGRKVVYCHAPARWLYQSDRYLARARTPTRAALATMRVPLRAWDRRAAAGADRYLANSTAVAAAIRVLYGREAEVLHPPMTLELDAPRRPLEGVEPGFVLCVSRLLPYKNVAAVVEAVAILGDERLVVVGEGPEAARLNQLGAKRVTLTGSVSDDELRWLYANARCLVSASYEDFGLTPVEAAAFGKPTAALRFGGFLDTIRDGETGVFFADPGPQAIADALRRLRHEQWDEAVLVRHADRFAESAFSERLREIVVEESAALRAADS